MSDDLFKKIGAGFSKVGAQLRSDKMSAGLSKVGSTLKSGANDLVKAAGIGVGHVSVELDAFAFRPGDEIRGNVVLALSEPTRAKRVVVTLDGSRDRVDYDKDSTGRTRQTRHAETVCQVERELAGEGEYQSQRFAFSITVPSDARNPSAGDGVLGDIARVVSAVASASRLPTTWRLIARVEIPWKRDVKKQVDITIND